MQMIYAPSTEVPAHGTSVFLGGSIEMGKAIVWQPVVASTFKELDVTFFNPRRDNWDPTWSQDPQNAHLRQQIRWELERIERSDIVLLFLQAGTMSPITLLELGLCLGRGHQTIVACEPGFWREANVHETCSFYGVEVHPSLQAGIKQLEVYLHLT